MASEPANRSVPVRPRRLWFGVVASGVAWFALGIAEMFITWRACLHQEAFGQASSHPAASVAAFVVSFFLIGLAAAAGYVSYITWRKVSTQPRLIEDEGRGFHAYLAFAGIFVSFTLGVGMVWMLLPLFILRFCARVR